MRPVRALVLATLLLAALETPAQAAGANLNPLPRADYFPTCPFTVASPSVVAVLTMAQWKSVLAASKVTPPPYDPATSDFRRESIFIVALPYASNAQTQAALSVRQPERFDPKTGTLTIFYDVSAEAGRETVGQPCLVSFTAARKDLQQVITRFSDGHFIAGTRTAEKPKKKGPTPVS